MTVKDLRTLVDNLEEYIHVPGGIERLKKTILRLAVSGQLVPQDSSKGTGEELYQQIQAEMQMLVAEGKLKKQKLLPKISEDEIPFEIPKTWKWVRLGEVVTISSSKRIHKSDYRPSGIPFFRSKEIGDLSKNKNIATELFISESKYNTIKSHFGAPVRDDVLVTSVGSIGNVWISDGRDFYYKDGNITQISKNSHVVSTFLKTFIKSDLFISQVLGKVSGTAYNALTIVKFNNLIFPLIPEYEQLAIVKKVDSMFILIDTLAERYKAEQEVRRKLVVSALSMLQKGEGSLALDMLTDIIKTKEDAAVLRSAILRLAVSGRLVHQDPNEGSGQELYDQVRSERGRLESSGKQKKQKLLPKISEDEIPFQIPSIWKWVRLGEVVDLKYGKGIDKSHRHKSFEYPFYGANGELDRSDRYLVKQNGIIVGRKGSAGAVNVAIGPFWPSDVTYYIEDGQFNAFDRKYLYYLLTSLDLNKLANGIKPGLNRNDAYLLCIIMFPLRTQTRIAETTTRLMELVNELDKHLRNE